MNYQLFAMRDVEFCVKLFAVFVAIYFPMMATMPLTIDAEFNATGNPIGWLMQGRWTTYIVTIALFRPVVPYLAIAFFGVCAALAYTLLVTACGLARDWKTIVAFPVFAGFPIWSALLEFPANTPSAGIALLACGVAAWLLVARQQNPLTWIGQIAAVTVAVGAYQSFIFVYAVMALAVVYFVGVTPRRLIMVVGVAVVSVAAHFAVQTTWLRAVGLSTSYIGNFFAPHYFLDDPVGVTLRSVETLGSAYAGSTWMFGLSLWAAPMIIIAALVIAARRSVMSLAILGAALASPLPLVVLSGGWLPIRTLISVPIAIGLCALVVLTVNWRPARYAGIALSGVLILQSVSAISQYQAARELTAKFDQTTAAEVFYRVAEVSDGGPKTVDLFGSLQGPSVYPVIPSSTAGSSFFSWDGGNPDRMLAYMRLIGYGSLVLPAPDERRALIPEYAEMPVWPAPGSVRMAGDVVIVKLSDQPGYYAP